MSITEWEDLFIAIVDYEHALEHKDDDELSYLKYQTASSRLAPLMLVYMIGVARKDAERNIAELK